MLLSSGEASFLFEKTKRPYFSEMIFLRSVIVAFMLGSLSSMPAIFSQELMIVEWSRPKASPMRGRLMPVISRVR